MKGRQAVAMHAACVYMACRLEHNPRTFKEILAGAPGTSKVCKACQGWKHYPEVMTCTSRAVIPQHVLLRC